MIAKRALEILRTEGPVQLVKSAANYIIDRGSSGQPFQVKRSEQTERRWEMIKTNISNEDQNLLDIGCDAGLLTAHAAEEGLLSIGVDRYETFEGAREYAHNLSKDKKNLGFINKGITPEGVDSLPNTDIVLMFSVYHYWYREFGKEAAEKMLGSLSGANKIFFSSTSLGRRYDPQEYDNTKVEAEKLPSFTSGNKQEVVEYHRDVLQSVLEENYTVEYIGDVPYDTETRYVLLATKQD